MHFDLSDNIWILWIWWVVLYAVFIALNTAGANISFKFAIVVSIISRNRALPERRTSPQ